MRDPKNVWRNIRQSLVDKMKSNLTPTAPDVSSAKRKISIWKKNGSKFIQQKCESEILTRGKFFR